MFLVVSLFIIIGIIILCFLFYKKSRKLQSIIFYLLLSIIIMLLLMWFGTIDVALWAFLSALLAGIIHFLSIDVIASFFGIAKTEYNKYQLQKYKTILVIGTPLLFLSMYIVKPEYIDFITKGKELPYVYSLNNDKLKLYYKSISLNDPDVEYSFSEKPYVLIVKYKNKSKKTVDYYHLIKETDLVAKLENNEYRVNEIIERDNKENVFLRLHESNRSKVPQWLLNILLALLRIYFIIGVFLLLKKIYNNLGNKVFRKMFIKLGGDNEIWGLQGNWYEKHKYISSSQDYFLSTPSFMIRGNILFTEKEQYKLKKSGDHIVFMNNKKGTRIHILKENELKIDNAVFVRTKVKTYDVPRNLSKRVYFGLVNNKQVFKYPRFEHVYYLDKKKNILKETRSEKTEEIKNVIDNESHNTIYFEYKNPTLIVFDGEKKETYINIDNS